MQSDQACKPPVNLISNALWSWTLVDDYESAALHVNILGHSKMISCQFLVPRILQDGLSYHFLRILKKNGWHEWAECGGVWLVLNL